MAPHGRHDPPEARRSGQRPSGERGLEVAEEPRPSETSTADDDAVAARRRDHPQRVLGAEDVAVAQHRQLGGQGVAQAGDGRPVRRAGVPLRGRARVQGDRRDPGVGGPARGVEVGVPLVVDADAHLHGDRPPVGVRHGRTHDRREQPSLVRQRGASAAARDLGDRAAEVHVDVVGEVALDDHPHRASHRHGVDAVELKRPRVLVGVEGDHLERQRVALDEPAGGDHLADVEAFALLAAQPSEAGVGDARHRRQHDRRGGRVRPDGERARDGGSTHAAPLFHAAATVAV